LASTIEIVKYNVKAGRPFHTEGQIRDICLQPGIGTDGRLSVSTPRQTEIVRILEPGGDQQVRSKLLLAFAPRD
jgi:hypothetical protein